MRRRIALMAASFAAVIPAACSSSDSATIQIVTGEETDTFTRSPAPTTLEIDALSTSGAITNLAKTSLPATTIDLGSLDETLAATIEVKGLSAQASTVVSGASLPVAYGSIVGQTVPVFVQRTGEFARMPGSLTDARQSPVLAVAQGRYMLIAGGEEAGSALSTQLYDFAQLAPLAAPPSLPSAPRSIALAGTVAWFIADDGGTYVDLSADTRGPITPPAGGSFADVVGGATVTDDAGALYVVGGTRTSGAASAAVLKIDPNDSSNASYPYGNPSWLTLSAPRLGAAAAWVSGRGLVVTGGSATAPGVEIVAAGGSTHGAALAYPPDPSVGAGASALDSGDVLLAGGITPSGQDAGARAVNLSCAAACTPTAWATLPVALGAAQAFTFSPTSGLVVGSEPVSGLTHAFLVMPSGATEVKTKTSHTHARAAWSPLGAVVLVGGSTLIESFRPTPQ